MNNEKIQKILSSNGYGSRRKIEKMIIKKKIYINNKLVKIGQRININKKMKILINKKKIILSNNINKKLILAYYKKIGEICTKYDNKNRITIYDKLPIIKNVNWISVGRLDINSCGIILFTNDGELAYRLMHPKYKIKREYIVRVFGKINNNLLNKLCTGIKINNKINKFKKICYISGFGLNKWFKITILEGRNKEIRKMFHYINLKVNYLIRISYGLIRLKNILLKVGKFKNLGLKYYNLLKKSVNY
ncbi:Ribosomal large subunit pseudouridine synthase B [Candidatus Annandia adelgestsuga]|uniref:Pseudouridine synthase n=1 Tax=Candidatus Annandia adelgestsuga TaxID=1302411 RepID=A0A3S9J7X3_9ENTR|nr:pseudouridine synthase [Candidatus Annandia adelgestsuga]AZP36410.1 Ribosomal large subunit pseudouridine synthase B [Candidatus Annandia adelgestsuga]